MRYLSATILALGILTSDLVSEETSKPASPPASLDFQTLSKITGILPLPDVKPRSAAEIAETRAARFARMKRVHVEPAMSRVKDAPYAEKFGAFMEKAFTFLSGSPDFKTVEISLEGRPLEGLGCADPLYYLLMGIVEDSAQAKSAWHAKAIAQAWKTESIPPSLLLWCAANRNKTERLTSTQKERLLAALLTTLSADSVNADPIELTVGALHTTYGAFTGLNMEDELRKAYASSALPDWAKNALLGVLEKDYAWKLRGGDWAANVTEDGWKGFRKHLEIAREKLTASWTGNPKDPKAAATMIQVTMGLGGDIAELQKWFHRAISAGFSDEAPYQYFINAISSKWGGSWLHMLAFGEACMDSGRYDTVVPKYLLGILSAVSAEVPEWRKLYSNPEIRDRVGKLLMQSLATTTDEKAKAELLGQAAVYAWLAGDYPQAVKHLEKGVIEPNGAAASILKQVNSTVERMKIECHIFSSAAKEPYLAAIAAKDEKNWDVAAEAFILARLRAPASAVNYLRGQLAVLEFEKDMALKHRAKVPMKDNNAGWTTLGASASINSDKLHLVGAQRNSKTIFEGRVPAKFVMTGRYSFPGTTTPESRDLLIIFGAAAIGGDSAEKGWNCFHFWSSKTEPKRIAALEEDYRPPNNLNKTFEFPDSGVFKLTRNSKGVSLHIDDKPVYENIRLPLNDENSHPHIGFGARYPARGMVLEISDVEIRSEGAGI